MRAHDQQTHARRWCKTCDVTKIPVPRFQLSMTLDLVTRAVNIVGLGLRKGLGYQLQQLATKFLCVWVSAIQSSLSWCTLEEAASTIAQSFTVSRHRGKYDDNYSYGGQRGKKAQSELWDLRFEPQSHNFYFTIIIDAWQSNAITIDELQSFTIDR